MEEVIRNKQSAIDKIFSKWDNNTSPGCSIAILHSGKIIQSQQYGMANLDYDLPITRQTIFRTGSLSKQFTAACIALLHFKQDLSIEDKFNKYFPEFDVPDRVKLKHLIYHTSGLKSYLELYGMLGQDERTFDILTNEEVLNLLQKVEGLNYPPGSKFNYSNSGYFLLGQLIKRVSGKSLREYAAENIFSKLNMKHTLFNDNTRQIIKNRATGYRINKGRTEIFDTTCDIVGDGGMFSTPEDLCLWLDNFRAKELGGAEFIDLLTTPGSKVQDNQEYGFGLVMSEYQGYPTISHGGAFMGFSAFTLYVPDIELGIAFCGNSHDINPRKQVLDVFDLLIDTDTTEKKEMENRSPSQSLIPGKYFRDKSIVLITIEGENDGKFPISNMFGKDNLIKEGGVYVYESNPRMWVRQVSDSSIFATNFREKEEEYHRIDGSELVELKEYEGTYKTDLLNASYTIKTKDSVLYSSHPKDGEFKLVNIYPDVFLGNNMKFEFIRISENKITELLLSMSRVRNLSFSKL